jgi:hypothetical protein
MGRSKGIDTDFSARAGCVNNAVAATMAETWIREPKRFIEHLLLKGNHQSQEWRASTAAAKSASMQPQELPPVLAFPAGCFPTDY